MRGAYQDCGSKETLVAKVVVLRGRRAVDSCNVCISAVGGCGFCSCPTARGYARPTGGKVWSPNDQIGLHATDHSGSKPAAERTEPWYGSQDSVTLYGLFGYPLLCKGDSLRIVRDGEQGLQESQFTSTQRVFWVLKESVVSIGPTDASLSHGDALAAHFDRLNRSVRACF